MNVPNLFCNILLVAFFRGDSKFLEKLRVYEREKGQFLRQILQKDSK